MIATNTEASCISASSKPRAMSLAKKLLKRVTMRDKTIRNKKNFKKVRYVKRDLCFVFIKAGMKL